MKIELAEKELYSTIQAGVKYNDESVLKLQEGGILQEIQDDSGAASFASFIPKSVIDTYDIEPGTKLGLKTGQLNEIIKKKDTTITFEVDLGSGVHKAKISKNGRRYTSPLTDVNSISNIPDSVPELDMPAKIWSNGGGWLMDFVSEAESYVHNGTQGSFFISVHQDKIYLYSVKDDIDLADGFEHPSSFNKTEVAWDRATPDQNKSLDIKNPSEEKVIEGLFSIDLVQNVNLFGESVRVEVGHGMPLKIVAETEGGTKLSWNIAPRFPKQGDLATVPDSVINDPNI
jgi:hypothetical protein